MTMLSGTIGHTFDGRVQRVQKVRKVVLAASPQFQRMILTPYRGSHDLDPGPDLVPDLDPNPDPDPDPDLARASPPIYISLSL